MPTKDIIDLVFTAAKVAAVLGFAYGVVMFLVRSSRFFDRVGGNFGEVSSRVLISLNDHAEAAKALVFSNERQAAAMEINARNVEAMERMSEDRRELGISMRAMNRKLNEALDRQGSPSEEFQREFEELRKKVDRIEGGGK